MQISEIKKGFWGLREESVDQYISELSEEFSQKMREKEKNSDRLIQELLEKNKVLENELEALRTEKMEYLQQLSEAKELKEAQRETRREAEKIISPKKTAGGEMSLFQRKQSR